MTSTDRNHNSVDDRFSLVVDQYGRLWLNAKLNGIPVDIELGAKDVAFQIMAETMSDHDFRYLPVQKHDAPDNDDESDLG